MNYTSEYITEEPDAVVPQVRICMGAVQVTGRSTMTIYKWILMHTYKTVVISLFACTLFACNGENDKNEAEELPILTGAWEGICQTVESSPDSMKHRIVTYKFGSIGLAGRYSEVGINYKFYETPSCITEKSSIDGFATYEIGSEITTAANPTAYEIDIKNGDLSLLKSIFRIEQSYLYFGLEKQDGSRPTEINFSFWHEKQ